ncbi:GumC family protein [Litoribaculum gwangyangense]|uniref:non-specific protein-tyrosine kinase n=1 Tax=Litoribaculum gwangyangense TaxID=1130722 RepID=A0ABP9CT43_9FLAO
MEKDIFKILLNYLRYWYLFLISSIICLVGAYFYVRYNVTPEYYASGKILLNDKEEGEGLQSFSNLGLIKNSKNINDEIGVLASYDLMLKTVKELEYDVSYYVKGRFSEIELYDKSVPFKVVINDSMPILKYGTLGTVSIIDEFTFQIETFADEESVSKATYNFGEQLSTEFGKFRIDLISDKFKTQDPIFVRFRNINNIASVYNNKVRISNVYESGGGLLRISLTDPIPDRAVDVINKLIEVYAKSSAENKNFLAQSTLKLIDERLDLLTGELNVAEKDVETYKQRNDLINVESDASRFVSLADEVERELAELRSEINTINALENSLIQSSDQSFSPISSYNINSSVLAGSILAYNTEVQRRKNLISASGIGNPMLPELDRQLIESKNLILQNVRNIKAQLLRTQSELASKSSQYRSKISSVPTAERALLEINRDQGIKQSLYLYLLQKREEEALSISVPFSDTRIIETPQATSYPVSGAKTPIYMGALIFGLFIPFVWVFLKDKLNTKILEKEDIEAITNTPILGKIPSSMEKDVVVVTGHKASAVAELFRLMRHNLKFLSQGKNNQVIMVTSGKPGEGKTFVSINIGASLAITGKKVVVLGFDLRLPKLMKNMNLDYEYGLSDFIVDSKKSVDDLIVPYEKEKNLFFIGSGPIPPNPGELMLHERVGELLEDLKDKFDYVIIDTPPIGKVADAYSLNPYIDSTLFVVRFNYTKKEELNVINEITENKRLKQPMIVFNDVKMEKSGVYSYGYGKPV